MGNGDLSRRNMIVFATCTYLLFSFIRMFFIAFNSSLSFFFFYSVGCEWSLLIAISFWKRLLAWFEHPLQRAEYHRSRSSPTTRWHATLSVEISRSEDVLDIAKRTRIFSKYPYLLDRFLIVFIFPSITP